MALLSENLAYLAGLFDGESCVTYKQRLEHRKGKPRAYKYWYIRIEIYMTDKPTIDYVHKMFGCGSLDYRPPYPHQNHGQYRWKCSNRDAYKVARSLLPFLITKKNDFKKIVDHYENDT